VAILDLSRRGDSDDLAGEISDLAAVGDNGGGVVTAVRSGAGRMKLIHWEIHPSGSVSRLGDSGDQAGEATNLAMAVFGKHVVACRAGNGKLKLISWDVSTGGPITRSGDSGDQAGEASVIRIVALRDGRFVVACRAGNGNLKLISWRLNANGSLTRLGDSGSAAGAVSEIALLDVSTTADRLLTAVRAGNGKLKLITWSVAASGAITRLGDSDDLAGGATMIRAVRTSADQVVTSVRDGSGNLKLISWSLPAAVDTIGRQGDSGQQAGTIGDNSLLALEDGVVSAVRTGSGNLKLISWQVSKAGPIVRRGDSGNQAGSATLIHLQPGNRLTEGGGGSITMITPVRTAGGNLKLINWGPTCVGVHVKILTAPTVSIDTMFTSMRQVYNTAGITVNRLTTENLNLPLLNVVDIGECAGQTTADQGELFTHRSNVGTNELVVYFVQSTVPPANGCAVHPDGKPGAVVTKVASQWTMAHEIGHVLGLPHCDTHDQCLLDRLMTSCGTDNITNPPPDLVATEVGTMQDSKLTVGCGRSS
jgi:hypothetical protein